MSIHQGVQTFRLIARGKLPSPGQGPSTEVRAKSWFRLLLIGEAENGQRLVTEVSGGDPGYTETSKMVSEAALLLVEKDELPQLGRNEGYGGVLTPAFAFGQPLMNGLKARGIRFHLHTASSSGDIAAIVKNALENPPLC